MPTPRTPTFPPGRYGRRRAERRRRPWLAGLLVVLLLVVMAAVAAQLYRRYGDPTYDAQVITYTEITDRQIVIDFRVTVPAGGGTTCVVRARARDGAEVGREQVTATADPGETQITVRHRLATTARPFVGEVVRCVAAG
ncbi:DUF4307 domain-containing protein [Micromonospora sp. NPDC049559]|uniref:DUF4307 domain-containing protein n=1 Tax=Micromonospora sp. NPDC049559 TaxID=3155923 RepID=UPI003414BE97